MSEFLWHIPDDILVGPQFGTLSMAPTNWGMSACGIDVLRLVAGEGQVIAILDTGVDASHPEFAGKIIDARSFVPGENEYDRNGHGSHCGSTAAGRTPTIGVATKAKLLFGKVLSNSGSGSSSWIEAGFRWAMSAGATVISMSIGGPGFLQGMEPLFREAVGKGIIPSVAAGNERGQRGGIADDCTALVWGAVDERGNYARFSNPGRQATTLAGAAPGVDIVGARTGGGYVSMSGTSMATPFGSGVVAVYQSERAGLGMAPLPFDKLRALFSTRNVDAGRPGPDTDYGPGLISGPALRRSLTAPPEVA